MRFRFAPKKAAQAAAYLLSRQGGREAYLKLIKLLYLADRKALLGHGAPITGARLVSMPFGPVGSEVLDLIKDKPLAQQAGANEIWTGYLIRSGIHDVKLARALTEDDTDELSPFEIRVMDDVLRQFGGDEKFALVDKLHKELPEWKDPDGSSETIAFETILRVEHFEEEKIRGIAEDSRRRYAMAELLAS